MKMPLQPLPEPDAHEKKPAGWDAYFQSYSKDRVQAIQRKAYEDGLKDAASFFDQPHKEYFGREANDAILAMLNTPKESK
jgi:hypothetical protein